jgi:tetratricopeptide (TPR) repeat protein
MTKNNRRLEVLPAPSLPARSGAPCGTRRKIATARKQFDVHDDLLAALRDSVMDRKVKPVINWIDEHRGIAAEIDPQHPDTPRFIGYLSQWVGVNPRAEGIVRELLTLFPQSARGRLALDGYLCVRLAEGILDLTGDMTAAGSHFDFIITLEQEAIDQEVLALAHFWKAQCERERGDWDRAIAHAARACAITLSIGYPSSAAIMQALEGCLNVQKRKYTRALELLQEAEAALRQTDDFDWLGNIQSAYGTIALEEGRYELALDHFTNAAGYYRERNAPHPDLAHSLTNLAHSQRLIAVRIARAIDTHAERRRRSAGCDSAGPADSGARQDVERLRAQSLSNFTDAVEMYSDLGACRAWAFAHVERGFLLVDYGDFDRAPLDASLAFELGCKIKDPAAKAWARLLQSRIESAQYEEGIGDAPAQHAQRAHDFAQDALTYASHAEDPRLLASAYLCQGSILCNEFFNNADAASVCCHKAGEFLTPGNRNELWEEHQMLTKKVARTGSVDSKLREWSQGLAGGKTFQQMSEEFAQLVIPSVWEKEGRNVSRVVAKLSISPKKVRRILSRAGLKTGVD